MASNDGLNLLAMLSTQPQVDSGVNYLARNRLYSQPAPVMSGYLTKLDPLQELAFQQWVKENKIPFDPTPTADYDMRGYYKSIQGMNKLAQASINANDGQIHFPDTFKTPYHESFSAESKFAAPGAPTWNDLDQLVTPNAKIVYDERKANGK